MISRLQPRVRRVPAQAANDNDPNDTGLGPRASILREYLMLLLVLLGIAFCYRLVEAFFDWDRIQTCVTMGLRNCTPAIELNRVYRPREAGRGTDATKP